jgi:predicted TIM-barrel fold metal-dependent hydrolase
MDACRVRTLVNLDGRCGPAAAKELADNLARYDRARPGRFVTFCQLDWQQLAEPDGVRRLVSDLHRAADLGAGGLKVWKDLGLHHRDAGGALVLPGDDRLAPVWAACADLGLPVLIHTADPAAFFDPVDARNERFEELVAHPDWQFGAHSFTALIGSLEELVAANRDLTVIGAHVGCCAENLGWVEDMLAAYPNFHVELGGRMAELGRQPRAARNLITRFPQRVLFGTDAFPPSAAHYRRWFRFLESADESFGYGPDHEVPAQGRWAVHALDLPPEALAPLYHGNAARILGLPA